MAKGCQQKIEPSNTGKGRSAVPDSSDIQRLLDLAEVLGSAERASDKMGWSRFKGKKWCRIARNMGMDGTWDEALFLQVREHSGIYNADDFSTIGAEQMAVMIAATEEGREIPDEVLPSAPQWKRRRVRRTLSQGCPHAVASAATHDAGIANESEPQSGIEQFEPLDLVAEIEAEIEDQKARLLVAESVNDYQAMGRAAKKILNLEGRLKALRAEQEEAEAVVALRTELTAATRAGDFLAVSRITSRLHAISSGKAAPKPLKGGKLKGKVIKKAPKGVRTFFITTAQNNTDAFVPGLESVKNWAKHNRGEIYAVGISYNRKAWEALGGHSKHGPSGEKEAWDYDPAIVPYLLNEDIQLAEDLFLIASLDVTPTAVNPLSGLEPHARGGSAIFPHTRMALQPIPRQKGMDFRHMMTTGAITQRNYIQRKTGQKAELAHKYGGIIVELDRDGKFFCRHVEMCDDGSFQDLTTLYTPDGVSEGHRVESFNAGDIHRFWQDEAVSKGIWKGKSSIHMSLKPRFTFLHDLSHFHPRNHHNINDPYHLARAYHTGNDIVADELEADADFVASIERPWTNVIIVDANHNGAFGKWLKEADEAHRDGPNAKTWHYWNYRVYEAIEAANDGFNVYESALRSYRPLPRTRFLGEDESFLICEDSEDGPIECGMHGHLGANGARGNPRAFQKLGIRAITGHTHSPSIGGDIWTVGVSGSLEQGYNNGQSSWSHTHAVVYPNGKIALITMRGSRWHASMHAPFVSEASALTERGVGIRSFG